MSNEQNILEKKCILKQNEPKKSHYYSVFLYNLKSASNLNGNLNCSKELEHYSS